MIGLSTQQAAELLKQNGPNVIYERKKKGILKKFADQVLNVLTILLIAAALLSFLIGEVVDGGLIFLIVILNALFGLYQESKAEEAIQALRKMTVTKVRVFRDGKESEIDSKHVVIGDVVKVEQGTRIPADGVVLESSNFELNEAALTGESFPVEKVKDDKLYLGTFVTKGHGLIQITATGMDTSFGKIASTLSSIDQSPTPLQKKLRGLTRIIGIAGVCSAVLVFGLNFVAGGGYFPSFLLAISLAVAVVPEGLPAVMTILLSIGVKTMSKHKTIVRRLSAIEAIGNVTLIATDKTGTLTANKMKVKELWVENNVYQVQQPPHLSNHAFSQLLLDSILCSTSSLVYIHDHGTWDVLGDPTEGALLYLAQDRGLMPEMVKNEWKNLREYSFDDSTKRMSVVVEKDSGKIVYTKGAAESILSICDKILVGNKEKILEPFERKAIEEQIGHWAKRGLRVLAFSHKFTSESFYKRDEDEAGQTFIGMVGLHDEPRPEVPAAIARAHEAGIKVVMITGDDARTAEAVGVAVGLVKEGDEVLNGPQFETYTDEQLIQLLPRVSIISRVTPLQKHRVVSLFQKMGEVVAVTGDGVNDSIALKQADVGVAMGLVGTDVARETADIIITDDNFSTIVDAVEEGRNIVKNLQHAVMYLLACNLSEAFALITGLLFGLSGLFTAIQFLYINLVTDGIPALSFGFSPRDEHVMTHGSQKKLELLGKNELSYILFVGCIEGIMVLASYFIFSRFHISKAAVFTVLTLTQSFILIDLFLSHKPLHSHFKKLRSGVFIIAFGLPFIFQFFILQHSYVASLFSIHTVSFFHYLFLVAYSSLIYVIIRIFKKVRI